MKISRTWKSKRGRVIDIDRKETKAPQHTLARREAQIAYQLISVRLGNINRERVDMEMIQLKFHENLNDHYREVQDALPSLIRMHNEPRLVRGLRCLACAIRIESDGAHTKSRTDLLLVGNFPKAFKRDHCRPTSACRT